MLRAALALVLALAADAALATSLPNVEPIGEHPAWTALCAARPGLCVSEGPASVTLTPERIEELEAVAAAVVRDNPWRAPSGVWSVLRPGETGTCADLAVTTMARLIEQGWPATVLRPVILFVMPPEMATPTSHMVLAVEGDDGTYVLDSRHPGRLYRFTDPPIDRYGYLVRVDRDGIWWTTFEVLGQEREPASATRQAREP